MQELVNLYRDRVLEPLCEATATFLKPLNVMPNDYLLIGVDDDIKRFVVRIVTLAPPTGREGERILDCPDGIQRSMDGGWPSWTARNDFFVRIPEKKVPRGSDPNEFKRILAGTDFTVLVIHHAWPKDQVIFSPEAKVFYNYILMRFLGQSNSASIIARFKVDGHVPDMPDDFKDRPEEDLKLSDYQKVALMASLNQPGYALFMEQGTGKTPITVARINLEGMRQRRDTGKMYKALIICPKQTRTNWEKEFQRFSVYPGKTSVLRGGQEKRIQQLNDGIMDEDDCDWTACIVSMDSVPSMWDFIKLVDWDLINFDESHGSKNPNSRRFKHFRKYAQFPHIRQRMPMTGTPIANNIMDLWAQLELCGEGLSGFMNFKSFRSFYGDFEKIDLAEGGSVEKLVNIKNMPLIQERLSRITFLMTSEEANLKLPDKLYDYAEVDMTKQQDKIYKRMAVKLVHEIEGDVEKRMSTDHILTKLLRLAQITSGHLTWDKVIHPDTLEESGGNVEQISEVNPKVQYVLDELTDPDRDPKGKMLLWACFVEDIRILSKKMADAGIKHVGYHRVIDERYRVKDAEVAEQVFNMDDSMTVMLANPASAGTGLNLLGYDRENPDDSVMYVNREIFFSCNWSFIIRDQGEKRGHRRGSRSPSVRITDLIVPKTIDEEIRERLKSKKKMAMGIQDIRAILRKLI